MQGKRQKLEDRLRWLLNEKEKLQNRLSVIDCLIVRTAELLTKIPLGDQVKNTVQVADQSRAEDAVDSMLSKSIDVLGLNENTQMVRGRNALKKGGVLTLADLIQHSEEELDKIWYVSPRFIAVIKDKLAALGLALRKP